MSTITQLEQTLIDDVRGHLATLDECLAEHRIRLLSVDQQEMAAEAWACQSTLTLLARDGSGMSEAARRVIIECHERSVQVVNELGI